MKAVNQLSSISYSGRLAGLRRDCDPRVVLLVSTDTALSHRLVRALNGNGNLSLADETPAYQVPVATSVAQARSCIGRTAPDVILLDESIHAPNLLTYLVEDLANIAPVIFLAAPENLAWWCRQKESATLVAEGRVECVARDGDFVPLAARLIMRHAGPSPENLGPHSLSMLASAVSGGEALAEEIPLDFGEVLRHEVNNPLTGILGNAELLLSRRDRLSADMVERLEIIADLAIRLRETVRRLSNALVRRPEASGSIPGHAPGDLSSSHRHRPPT
ncbi:MAG TPA: histidine kinase dimerization/phospho-acceptor domain-containing protein [Candidatus Acidoferrales bacterium]|jgi:signal transduction histidine kinase|nr:histidine kinase dimerization/phospho-acceptor domain-containing protein [Candidatus Acidoferrales bacterium]